MKKIISIILSVLMLTGILAAYPVSAEETTPITPDTSWYNNEDSEFTITTAAQLLGIASVVNSESGYFRNKTIKLGADIVLNEGNAADWETNPPVNSMNMIGNYLGTFDGQGYTISGLYRQSTGNKQGLMFGTLEANGIVKDLAIINSYYEAKSQTGGIVGKVEFSTGVQFKNVYADITMRGAAYEAGGFVGNNAGSQNNITFENCVFAGDINMTGGSQYIGGFIGKANGNVTFSNCLNLGSVSADEKRVSGFVGDGTKTTFDRCVNFGKLYAPQGLVGGIIGNSATTTMTNSYIATDVTASTNCGAVGNDPTASYYGFTEILSTAVKGEAAKTVMPALDWENTWTTTENGLPMIKYFAELHDKLTEPETPKYVGAQTKAGTAANTVDVRFTGLIGDYKDYETIGFKFTYNGKEETVNCLKVYNGLVADGFTVNPEYHDGKYFYCFSIRGLSAGTYEFGVECVAQKTGGVEATSAPKTVTVTVDASGNATVS